jgi:hypothetical protein
MMMRQIRRGVFTVILTGVLAGGMGAASASAQLPWWHVSSISAPTNLRAGVGRDEVQVLTVRAPKPGEEQLILAEPVAIEKEEFVNAKGEPEFAILPANASALAVEEGLESFYGAGNVKVTGGPGDSTGSKPYTITFTGALADKPLRPVNTAESPLVGFTGEAQVAESSKGTPDGQIVVNATNLGDEYADPEAQPVTITDKLPPGFRAVKIEGVAGETIGVDKALSHGACSLESLSCTFNGKPLPPYDQIQIVVSVKVEPGAKSGEVNEASITGGGAPSATGRQALTVDASPTPFGVQSYEMTPEEEGGSVDTQAGSHPFQLTTTLMFNETLGEGRHETLAARPAALIKDLHFKLPPGLVGNPTPVARCTLAQFAHQECLSQTVVGVSRVIINVEGEVGSIAVPLYNLEPEVGEPARFGFIVPFTLVVLDTSLRTGGDYGVTVTVSNISQIAEFLGSEVTFWGVPGDPRHDNARNFGCMFGERGEVTTEPCNPLGAHRPPPLLSLPTSCAKDPLTQKPEPLHTTIEADSWKQEGSFVSSPSTEPMPALDGCNRLPFSPSISVAPDGQAGSTPTGLTVGVHVPQDLVLNPTGLAEANVKDTTVALPAGVAINPASADGLQSCSVEQIGLDNAAVPACPEASKVGTLEIRTPLLPDPLTGAVYLAAQNANPFGSLAALYMFVEDPVSGSRVKFAGEVKPDPVTGQLTSTFLNTPQLPFEDLKLHFFGGDRAPLATPGLCGPYTTVASIAPWSGNEPTPSSSTFDILSGPNGTPCQTPLPFNPALTAGTTSIQAGGFSSFTMTMSRGDGNQDLQAIKLKMPPGLVGSLAGVKLCGEPQADLGTCPPESLIGHTIVSVGVGGDPYSVKGGEVFITGPYKGAPYGLSIVNPAKAGPYDLGKVIVRAKIEVDPLTAALTVTTDTTGPFAIPHILDGIPLQIQHVNVTIDRPGFTFNPTNCSPLAITGSLTSVQGETKTLSVPFQITNCAVLAFKPKLTVHTAGKTSRANGASLSVKLTYPAGPYDANIAKVKVDLPKQLPSKLPTLQKACPAATFEANPANCPPASIVGHAKATTPVLPVALTGPAYFVSHGGEAFPDLIIVLQGYGTTVHLVGSTFISEKTGITSSTFKTVPDVPVGTFELTLPQGKYSALAATANLCTTKLVMPTSFIAQNGASIHTNTPITPTGCTKHKRAKKSSKHHKGNPHGKK